MKVAELMAGGGYTTELLARAVGPKGMVYGQNNKLVLDRFAEKPWTERLAKPVMKNVVRVDRELDDPLPPKAKNLDAVFMVLFYHDTVWLGRPRQDEPRRLRGAQARGRLRHHRSQRARRHRRRPTRRRTTASRRSP